MTLISVIIPFFNRHEWTNEAVKSVLSQTYQNFEIILIDDGSKDDYQKKFSIEDNRIRYYRQEKQGRSSARNYGLSLAKGEFITFLDSDDLYYPIKLEKQLVALKEHPEAGMSYTNFQIMDESGLVIEKTWNHQCELRGDIYPDLLFFIGTIITTPSVMVRREIFELAGIFDKEMDICEDLDLWRRIARVTLVIQIHEPLIFIRYRNSPESFWRNTRGRSYYYKKAILDDPSLKGDIEKKLYSEMYFQYCASSLKRLNIVYSIYAFLKLILLDPTEALRFTSLVKNKIKKIFFQNGKYI